MKKRLLAAAATVVAAALALSACSTAPSDTGADQKKEIRVASTDPQLIIPGRQSVAYDVNMAVWSPLAFLNSDGSLDYVQAQSIESPDATTWTVKLRDGWTFQDGTPVTAQSYVDSWNAVAYGPNAFENSGQLANIAGYADLNPKSGTPATDKMSGLKVVDTDTFTVTLIGPDSQFPLQVTQAQTAMYPMPASAFTDFTAYNKHPVGNGPFQFAQDYVENEPIVLDTYSGYKGDKPTIDRITFVPYTDSETAYTDVLAGNLDVAGVPASKLTQASTDFGQRLYSFAAPGISFLGLPLWNAAYQDVRVRQAISMAIDRQAIIDVIYGGTYDPATAWTPAIEPGTPTGICGEYCSFDPEAAKALLAQAGGFTGPMEIYYPGGSGLDPLYQAIANQLRQNLGIDATAKPSADWAEFLQNRNDQNITGPFFSRWGALYPSQQATLRVFFIKGGGCNNCIPWYSDEVASAMTAADADLSTDGSAYASVQQIIQKNFPAVPLFFEKYSYVTSPRVAELVTSPVGNPTYRSIVLSK